MTSPWSIPRELLELEAVAEGVNCGALERALNGEIGAPPHCEGGLEELFLSAVAAPRDPSLRDDG